MKTVLFVCTGNICRSPMAEGLFREAAKPIPGIQAKSAGLSAINGSIPSQLAIEAVRRYHVDISNLRSRMLTRELIEEADFIFAMTRSHQRSVIAMHPSAAEKTFLVREFDENSDVFDQDVIDPIGLGQEFYEECCESIRRAIPGVLRFVQQSIKGDELLEKRGDQLTVALGADHGGVEVKKRLRELLEKRGVEYKDFGTNSAESVDYPEYSAVVAKAVTEGEFDRGILICKSGIGMSIAANRIHGARAALCFTPGMAMKSRQHNDSNILCLAAESTPWPEVEKIVNVWLDTSFEGGRHERRVEQIDQITDSSVPGHSLADVDPEVFSAIVSERQRQQQNIELIASENFTSPAVMEAQGSVMTNKYAEGYPGKRWYGGCENVDIVETLAIDRVKRLFSAEHANVQPHSGSQANMAVYFSILQPGDRILTMDLAHGGHLTHGHKMNFSGRFFEVTHYGVNPQSEGIDYDELMETARRIKPRMITAGASAYSRIIDFRQIGEIAADVGALLFVDMAHIAGLVAAGLHPSPIPYADYVTSTTHKTLRGPRGGVILCKEKYAKEIDSQTFPGIQGGPVMHVIAAKAVCFHEAFQPGFKVYQQQVIRNAQALAERMVRNGYRIVSGKTENHLMLVDLQPQKITGRQAQMALDEAGITVNKNAIPFDKQSPYHAGGIRLGSPAVTTRGFKETEMRMVGDLIHRVLQNPEHGPTLKEVRTEVRQLTERFPLPY